MKLFRHQQGVAKGFTLLEILIAMLIGLFLIAGILQIFINSKQSYRMQEALARMQESGRFALDFLDRDIRMAGYRGCASRSGAATFTNNLTNATAYAYNFSNPIQGFDTTASSTTTTSTSWSPEHTSTTTGVISPAAGSDIITIRRAADDGVQITGSSLSSKTLTLSRNTVPGIAACDIAIVSDCSSAAVFKVASYNGANTTVSYNSPACSSGGNATVLDRTYLGGSFNKAQTTSYYVKLNSNQQPSLYRLINQNEDELVEGVEKMQIFYGQDLDNNGTPDSYVTANLVTQWNNVVSVRISLLLRTIEDNIASRQLNYTYEDINNQTAPDKRIRRVFTTTIAIRNRLK